MAPSTTTMGLPRMAASRRPRTWGLRVIGAVVAGYLVMKLVHVFGANNFHAVIPGKIYRGAQPSPAVLQRLVNDYGIRTIVNLRGTCVPQEWYMDESGAAQSLGISLHDLTFSAGRWPSHHEIRHLVETLESAEYPIFMHCRQGADRTGMASAIAQVLVDDVAYAEARRQLSMRYGHAPIGHPTILDRFFDAYEAWLRDAGRRHDRDAFRHWLLEEYRGGQWQCAIEEVVPLQATWRVGDPIGFRVCALNASPEPWRFRPTRTAGMHLGFQLWDSQGQAVAAGRAGLLDKVVPPGELVTVTLVIPPVTSAGRYRLMIDMVDENHCWFYQTGSEPWEGVIDVRE